MKQLKPVIEECQRFNKISERNDKTVKQMLFTLQNIQHDVRRQKADLEELLHLNDKIVDNKCSLMQLDSLFQQTKSSVDSQIQNFESRMTHLDDRLNTQATFQSNLKQNQLELDDKAEHIFKKYCKEYNEMKDKKVNEALLDMTLKLDDL